MIVATDKNRVQTFVKDELYDWLRAKAERENRSLSNVVETILEEYKQTSEKLKQNTKV